MNSETLNFFGVLLTVIGVGIGLYFGLNETIRDVGERVIGQIEQDLGKLNTLVGELDTRVQDLENRLANTPVLQVDVSDIEARLAARVDRILDQMKLNQVELNRRLVAIEQENR